MSRVGLLSGLARRAVAAPEVRPRLASRFETLPDNAEPQRPAAAATGIQAVAATPPIASVGQAGLPAVTPVVSLAPQVRANGDGPAWPHRAPPPTAAAPPLQLRHRTTVDAPQLVPLTHPADHGAVTPAAITPPTPGPAAPAAAAQSSAAAERDPPVTQASAPRLRDDAVQPLLAPTLPRRDAAPGAAPVAPPAASRRALAVPAPALQARHDAAPAGPPPIEITIGRIDVRAVPEAAPRAAPSAPAGARTLGLADYLRRRSS